MGKIAFVFAGQGAQHPGMGRDLYDASGAVRALFDEAERRRPGTLETMFSGADAELKKTENTQPCLYLADLAAAAALTDAGVRADAAAGFSLGEIPALAFAGAYSAEDGFTLACLRGEAMGRAANAVSASMAAVVKLTNEEVEALCAAHGGVYPVGGSVPMRYSEDFLRTHSGVYPVNYNCPGQLVVSARTEEMKSFCDAVKAAGGRAIPLNVGGGFHSPFMDGAAEEFGARLGEFDIHPPHMTVYSNYTAAPYGDDVRSLLREQVRHPVYWEKIVRALGESGVDTFVECGPGNTLAKLIAKILPEARTFSVETAEQARAAAKEILG